MPGLSRILSYMLRTRPLLSRFTLRYALLHVAFPSPDAAAMVTYSSHAQTPMLFVLELALAQYLRCIHIHLYRIRSPIHHLHRTPAALSGARHDDLLRRYMVSKFCD